MNILRRYGFPRLLMPSSLVLPPVDHCRGTSPSQAANSRPLLKAAPFPMADMYGAPPDCKKNGLTRNSLRKCIRPLVEIGLRAHDDDPRVPVLIIAAVVKDLVSPQVFRHAV